MPRAARRGAEYRILASKNGGKSGIMSFYATRNFAMLPARRWGR